MTTKEQLMPVVDDCLVLAIAPRGMFDENHVVVIHKVTSVLNLFGKMSQGCNFLRINGYKERYLVTKDDKDTIKKYIEDS